MNKLLFINSFHSRRIGSIECDGGEGRTGEREQRGEEGEDVEAGKVERQFCILLYLIRFGVHINYFKKTEITFNNPKYLNGFRNPLFERIFSVSRICNEKFLPFPRFKINFIVSYFS